MARASLESVSKRFGDVGAVEDFTLLVNDGELVTILGPSGCGKSTVLRLIAGLEDLSSGMIHLDERRIDEIAPHERDVAMVFQSYALYPHMTARANVEFPLRMRGVARAERRQQAEQLAALLEIEELLDRRPGALSGGQRQRVALARALVRRPKLFLLDEPLSNLDALLRVSVRQYIRGVQRRLGVTTLYVTHDQTEAMTLGDRIVILDQGRMQQCGTPLEIYERPANAFVAGFIGSPPMNLMRGRSTGGVLQVEDQCVTLDTRRRELLGANDQEVIVGVRPEAFVPLRADEHGARGFVAKPDPDSRELLGSEMIVAASVGAERVIIRRFGSARDLPDAFLAPLDALYLFSARDGRRLAP